MLSPVSCKALLERGSENAAADLIAEELRWMFLEVKAKRLLEKHAIAPGAARLYYFAPGNYPRTKVILSPNQDPRMNSISYRSKISRRIYFGLEFTDGLEGATLLLPQE